MAVRSTAWTFRSTTAPGGGYPGYTVFLKRTVDGVELPDYRVVEVDGSDGSVISLVNVRRPVAPPAKPEVSAEAAIKAISTRLHDEHVVGAHQTISFDASGQQHQVWEVGILSDDPAVGGRVMYVDALTGTVTDPLK